MSQIITPTRLFSQTPTFPTTNPGIAAFDKEREETRLDDQNQRSKDENQRATDDAKRRQDDWDRTNRDRQSEDDVYSDIIKTPDASPPPNGPSTAAPSPTLSGNAGTSPNYDGPDSTPAPAADMAPPTKPDTQTPAPALAPGPLSNITSAPSSPVPSALSLPPDVSTPAVPPPTPTPPPATPPQPLGLASITSQPKPPTVGNFDVQAARALASRGLGRKAADAYRSGLQENSGQLDKEYAHAKDVLDAASAGDFQRAQLLIKTYGITDIDPNMLTNSKAVKAMKDTLFFANQAKALHDQDWQHRFMQTYTQSNGNVEAAWNAAGKPKEEPAKAGTFSHFDATVDNKPQTMIFDSRDGTFRSMTGVGPKPSASAGGRKTNEQINFGWMTSPRAEGGLGMSIDDAQNIIKQVKQNPGAKENLVAGIARALISGNGVSGDQATDEALKAYDKIHTALNPTAPVSDAPAAAKNPGSKTEENRQYMLGPKGVYIYHVEGDPPDVFYRYDHDTRYNGG